MKFITHKKYSELYELLETDKIFYKNGIPFPNIVMDDIFDSIILNSVDANFPKPGEDWWKYYNPLEKKYAKDNINDFPCIIRDFIHELMGKMFVDYLEKLTGIEGLVVDHHLNGGGLHQHGREGKLDVHADYNYHPKTGLHRRINVLVYLNQNWDPKWKGQLEFWDKDMTECKKSIDPIFNRMVIFNTTDDSLHGLPDPLECPEGIFRKSIAMYYYTKERPTHERTSPHSTLYKRRPQDPLDEATEELRKQRAIRRIDANAK